MLIDNNKKSDCSVNNRTDAACGNVKNKSKFSNLDRLLMNISAFSLQGKRSHMEDFFDIGYQLKPEELQKPDEWPYEYFYFGIFDGHGGCDAAKFAKENLLKYITKQPSFWSDNDEDILRSIRKGYADTHEAMRKIMHQWPKTHKCLPSTAGTTASVLFIKNGKYYTGHVGDSRIVISKRDQDSKQWISEQLTEDHKPESESELARIRRAGGDVKPKVGVHRVVWKRPVLMPEFETSCQYAIADKCGAHITKHEDQKQDEVASYPIRESFVSSYQIIPFLAIARSLGDFWSINPYSGQYIVSPEPDVSCRHIDPNDECILLATDGLWSVVNSQQAIRALEEFKAVRENERQDGAYSKQYFSIDNFYNVTRPLERDNYALSLVYLAYQVWERRSLRSDNITVVVSMLGDILGSRHTFPNKRNYRTRSNSILHRESISCIQRSSDMAADNTFQIGRTRKYNEIVRTNRAPSFQIEPMEQEEIIILERLGNWLMLPPSAVPQVRDTMLIPPMNYTRLDKAEVRKIKHPNGRGNILIRRVSDDPLDEDLRPERTGKKPGISVRDASAQCTQSIYDFALSWPGEGHDKEDDYEVSPEELADLAEDLDLFVEDEDIEDNFDEDEDDEDDDDDDDEDNNEEDDDDIDSNNLEDGDPDDEDAEDHLDDDDGIEELTSLDDEDTTVLLLDTLQFDMWAKERDRKNSNNRIGSKEDLDNSSKEHMLQPRSENCKESPKCRRRTRSGAYLSLTSGPKRKVIHESPKSKRRKSHPLQCSVGQS